MFLKQILSEKDNLILSLHQELANKDTNIKKLKCEIIQLKKEKQEQEESFQSIIKDFQFLNEYNSNNLNSQPNNYDSNNKKVKILKNFFNIKRLIYIFHLILKQALNKIFMYFIHSIFS